MKIIKTQKLERHLKVLEILKKYNYEGRFVGGFVKNTIINEDINDIDIATNAPPDEVINVFANEKIKSIPTGLQHGTVTVLYKGMHYELTTLRKDVKTYGRSAEVKYINDWAEDALRRDFTMNAIFIDMDGKIYDYFDGLKDLKNGNVKFIGNPDERIKEDYLRILRYFRFVTLYGNHKSLDKESLNACIRHKNNLRDLSKERITKEMLTLLSYKNYDKTIKLMYETGILREILGDDIDIERLDKLVLKTKYFESKVKKKPSKKLHKDEDVESNENIVTDNAELNSNKDNKIIKLKETLAMLKIFTIIKESFTTNDDFSENKLYNNYNENNCDDNKVKNKTNTLNNQKLTELLTCRLKKCHLMLSKKQIKILQTLLFFYKNFTRLKIEYKDTLTKYISYYYYDFFDAVKVMLNVFFEYEITDKNTKLECPLTSKDIMNLGFKGKEISDIKIKFEKYWLKNNCDINSVMDFTYNFLRDQ